MKEEIFYHFLEKNPRPYMNLESVEVGEKYTLRFKANDGSGRVEDIKLKVSRTLPLMKQVLGEVISEPYYDWGVGKGSFLFFTEDHIFGS